MTDEENQEEDIYTDELEDFVSLYDAATNEQGRGSYFTELEPDLERWRQILAHPQFNDDMRQLDELMQEYDHVIELQVGEDSFEQVHINNQSIPDNLNFYIAEEPEQFREDVNHRFFRNVDEDNFTVPSGSAIGFKFDSYRDTIDIPEELDHVDVSIPTRASHLYKQAENNADFESNPYIMHQDLETGHSVDEYDMDGYTRDF